MNKGGRDRTLLILCFIVLSTHLLFNVATNFQQNSSCVVPDVPSNKIHSENTQPLVSTTTTSNVFGSPADEEAYQRWLPTFKAADPSYQEACMNALAKGKSLHSEYAQDVFLFMNFYKYWPMQGRKGFYVDSGANDALVTSNTAFFDKCLGWKGLCVEPDEQYHNGIRQHRTCTLIGECISDVKKTIHYVRAGTNGHVAGDAEQTGAGDMKCAPLEDMLSQAGIPGLNHVDLWSLDVEGHEMTVLSSVDFKKITFSVLLIEDFWVSTRDMDLMLTRKDFIKFHQLGVDSLFANRSFPYPAKVWYPENYDGLVQQTQAFRENYRKNLKC